ncbi:DUF262 domain-containing protein (plasmid) [Aliarcobacter cibarius]|uniref:DUF262 domain-containing protein n=1 Tax=Aliarcobacter cibarius TaxID=255507 RepID=UPI001245F187|nr:DUF262 domain-containing protein [Aliarcobacter cibarius]QEZ90295.1 DUF262 domain-containing protein [Aliarcobacter cibarius]
MSEIVERVNIIKVQELLEIINLKIPEYQRPYKWTIKNVNQLIDDILYFKNKNAYRLGTIVLHKDQIDNFNYLNIVDGQQRTTTLFLIFLAVMNHKFEDKDIEKLKSEKININSKLSYTSSISHFNIQQNYQEILRRVKNEFDMHIIDFLLEKCEIVIVQLTHISEAFQFFDSQNARGKDLVPHDLLKAFHLREMFDYSEEIKTYVVKTWENINQPELAKLFNDRLFRIRNWSKGNSAKYFTKNDVDLFKGLSINSKTKSLEPYAKLYQIANIFVDNYNNNSDRLVDFTLMSYPFQLDLPILNGRRFFEMITYYINKYDNKKFLTENKTIQLINDYSQKNRTGDKYIRMLFDCALIFYIDKFGQQDIEKIVEKLFIWAYSLRLIKQAVYLETIDNYVIRETQVFKIIRDANSSKDVVNMKVDNLVSQFSEDIKIDEKIKEKIIGYFNGK